MVLTLVGDSTITTFMKGYSLEQPATWSRLPPAVRPRDMETPRLRVKFGRPGSGGGSGRALDVRLREIFAFEQERCAGKLCLSVGKTVTEIELGRMLIPLAVTVESFKREMCGGRVYRLDFDPGSGQELH